MPRAARSLSGALRPSSGVWARRELEGPAHGGREGHPLLADPDCAVRGAWFGPLPRVWLRPSRHFQHTTRPACPVGAFWPRPGLVSGPVGPVSRASGAPTAYAGCEEPAGAVGRMVPAGAQPSLPASRRSTTAAGLTLPHEWQPERSAVGSWNCPRSWASTGQTAASGPWTGRWTRLPAPVCRCVSAAASCGSDKRGRRRRCGCSGCLKE